MVPVLRRICLLPLFAVSAAGALVDQTSLRTVSVQGGGAAKPSVFHVHSSADNAEERRECSGCDCNAMSADGGTCGVTISSSDLEIP